MCSGRHTWGGRLSPGVLQHPVGEQLWPLWLQLLVIALAPHDLIGRGQSSGPALKCLVDCLQLYSLPPVAQSIQVLGKH